MIYIDVSEYRKFTGDEESPEEDIEILLQPASDIVNSLCHNRIMENLSQFNSPTVTQIKKATAAEVQYLYENGGVDSVINGVSTYGGNIRIGDFSYGDGRVTGQTVSPIMDSRINQYVIDLLLPTGLLYAGVKGCKCGI